MKVRIHNNWIEQIKSGDFPYHSKITILAIGRIDYQYCLEVLNFVIILEI